MVDLQTKEQYYIAYILSFIHFTTKVELLKIQQKSSIIKA